MSTAADLPPPTSSAAGAGAGAGADTGTDWGRRSSSPLDVHPAPLPLFEVWPRVGTALATVSLGTFPTPVESLDGVMSAAGLGGSDVWVKRDDVSSPVYGGNKVRTLEVLFGGALARGSERIYSTGAFGSNHAAATVLHARRVGLEPGVILFPQPRSATALENLEVVLSHTDPSLVHAPWHWSMLPLSMFTVGRGDPSATVMEPGGATPHGALGYVSAAFELARQVEAGELPRPRVVVIGVGSTCTSAGLLVGLQLAARLGIGFVDRGRPAPPALVSVRVTPWPVTAALRIVRLGVRTSRLLARLAGEPSLELAPGTLRAMLTVDGGKLGWGYGVPTAEGRRMIELFERVHGLRLDTTYSAKAAAGLLDVARHAPGPILFWSTKSTVPLPPVDEAALEHAPWIMRRWIVRARNLAGSDPDVLD